MSDKPYRFDRLGDLTWSCHVCGRVRPDDKISVFTTHRVTATGVKFQTNVRYCNDSASCAAGAPAIDFMDPERRPRPKADIVPKPRSKRPTYDVAMLVLVVLIVALCLAVLFGSR